MASSSQTDQQTNNGNKVAPVAPVAQIYTQIMKNSNKIPVSLDDAEKWESTFWSSEPVTRLNEFVVDQKQICELKIQKNQYNAPATYQFQILDLSQNEALTKLTNFISSNYIPVCAHVTTFYDKDFIKFICAKGVNLCLVSQGYIGGFIHVDIKKFQVYDKEIDAGDVTFLCVHQKLRHKGIAEILIKEVTRQISNEGCQIGTFMTNRYVPSPFSTLKIYHRPINYIKLTETNYIKKSKGDIDSAISYYKVYGELSDKIVELTEENYEAAYECYKQYVGKYCFYEILTLESFIDKFCSNPKIKTYLFYDDNKNPVDFLSYFTICTHKKLNIKACHLYMYTSNLVTPVTILKNLSLFALKDECDVVTVTDCLENQDVLVGNKFLESPDTLKLYFYNYKCPTMNCNQVCSTIL